MSVEAPGPLAIPRDGGFPGVVDASGAVTTTRRQRDGGGTGSPDAPCRTHLRRRRSGSATRSTRSCVGGLRADDARRLITVSPPGSPQRTRTPGTRNRAAPVLPGADVSVSTGSPDSGGLRRRAADGSTPGPPSLPSSRGARDGARTWQVAGAPMRR
ncbi:hypothetical protein [Streptomyces sp. NPDC054783]